MAFDGRLLGGISVLAAVVETGNFVRAAEALGLTQSGISRAVARLEARIGVRLLDRTPRAVSLTDEGRRFHAQVAPLLAGLEEVDPVVEGFMRIGFANEDEVEAVKEGAPAGGLMSIEVVAQEQQFPLLSAEEEYQPHHDGEGSFVKFRLLDVAEQFPSVVLVRPVERLDEDFNGLAQRQPMMAASNITMTLQTMRSVRCQ